MIYDLCVSTPEMGGTAQHVIDMPLPARPGGAEICHHIRAQPDRHGHLARGLLRTAHFREGGANMGGDILAVPGAREIFLGPFRVVVIENDGAFCSDIALHLLGMCAAQTDHADLAARPAAPNRYACSGKTGRNKPWERIHGGLAASVDCQRRTPQPVAKAGRQDDHVVHSAPTFGSRPQAYCNNCSFSGDLAILLAKLQRVARLTPSTTSSVCWLS